MADNLYLTVNGQKKLDWMDDLIEVVVDTNLHLPNMFSIVVADDLDPKTGKLKYTDDENIFKLGAEVKIEIETDEIPDESARVKSTVIIGEITAIEPAFTTQGQLLLQIRGFDRSHRLTRGKKTRTFGDANPRGKGITETQVINTIVRETEGITQQKIDTSGLNRVKHHYVMQYNQTDLEFLWSRARTLGYQVYVDDKTLYFQKADAHRGKPNEKPAGLTWPVNLESFYPRLAATHQVDQAVVKGWDPKTKKSIESKTQRDKSKTSPQKIGQKKGGGSLAKRAFKGKAETMVVNHPVTTIDQAKAIAAARFAEVESEFIQAEGVCKIGDPRLIAGRVVAIKGIGERFSGNYYVTEARHVYARGKYRVTFGVTGRAPYTATHLLQPSHGHKSELIQGVVTAKVTSLQDPENLGRVKVMYPWLPKYKNADLASNWARLAAPMGGKDRGMFFMPEVDDEVLIAFEHGDMNFPYVVGVLWNHKDKPPKGTSTILAKDKKQVNQRVLRSRSGHLVILDDTKNKEQIIIQDKTKKNKIVIDSKKNAMTINVQKDVTIVAKGKANIESTSNLVLKSKGDVSIQCKNFEVKAQANSKLQATSSLTLQGTSMVNVQNGSGAKVALRGPTVNMNNGALEVI